MRAAMRSIKRGQFVIVMHIGVEIALLLHHDFGAAGGQPDQIEAETGIERIAERIEPLAKQPVDHLGSGHGLAGIHRDRAHRAVGAEETRFQPPRALALLVHRRDQRLRPAADKVAAITPSVATGSANRFSTM